MTYGIAFLTSVGLPAGCTSEQENVAQNPTPIVQTGATEPPTQALEYIGVETRLMRPDLVNIIVRVRNPSAQTDITDYAKCAAAQYTLIRGRSFAGQVKIDIAEQNGVWTGNGVYTVSAEHSVGSHTIDAEVQVEDCTARNIPRV